jgi:hypothetical protein
VPTYGPLGPGLTANVIAAFAQANGGIDNDLLLDLASQQQSELSTLIARTGLGSDFATATAAWSLGLATRASADRRILSALCRSQQLRAARAAAEAAAGAAPPTGASEGAPR